MESLFYNPLLIPWWLASMMTPYDSESKHSDQYLLYKQMNNRLNNNRMSKGLKCCYVRIIMKLIITTTMFMVLSSWPKSLREFTRFIWWMQTERRVAANPPTKPIDLGRESAKNWLLPFTFTIAIVIITQPLGWYSFYCPTEGGRLSRHRHCSKSAQPVPKAVYRSGCRNKPEVDSIECRGTRPNACFSVVPSW